MQLGAAQERNWRGRRNYYAQTIVIYTNNLLIYTNNYLIYTNQGTIYTNRYLIMHKSFYDLCMMNFWGMAIVSDDLNKLEKLQAEIQKLKAATKKEKAKAAQEKFIKTAAEQGKKRVGIMLSDSAISALKKAKADSGKSTADLVESLLLDVKTEPVVQTKTVEKIVYKDVEKIIFKPSFEQQKTIEQAAEVSRLYKIWIAKPNSSVAGKNLSDACGILADLT